MKISNIRSMIRKFTEGKPSKDQDYREHLAKYSRLYELDNELSALCNEEPEDAEEAENLRQKIEEIGEEVRGLVKQ